MVYKVLGRGIRDGLAVSIRRRRSARRPLGSGLSGGALMSPALQWEGSWGQKNSPRWNFLSWLGFCPYFSPALLRYPGSSSTRGLLGNGERSQRVTFSG